MIKRDELSNPDSCMSRALPHERTFVLLARDEIAPKAIREWCRLRCLHGKNSVKDPQIREALECADLMELERNDIKNELLTKVQQCIRAEGHSGPCNGFPRPDCIQQDYVAWMCYRHRGDQPYLVLCDSDEPGAFKVYRRKA